MAQEVKYNTSHHAGATPEARIANRLRNSGGEEADHIVQKGSGPTRTFTNVHNPPLPVSTELITLVRVTFMVTSAAPPIRAVSTKRRRR